MWLERIIRRPGARRADRPSSVWWLLLVGLTAALICAPFFRGVYFLGDEGIFLRAAELILQGKRFFIDFVNISPGATLLTAAWFSVAGISIGSARSLAILTIVGIACFTYLACRRSSRNAPLSALLVIAWLMMSQGQWTVISHHWFTTLFSMTAAWAALASLDQPDRGLRWPVISGVAAGAAAMCTPNSGGLVAVAAMTAFFNLRRSWAPLIAYGLGCVLAPAGVLAYLVEQHVLGAAFDEIQIAVTEYNSVNAVPFGYLAGVRDRFLVYIFPLSALLTLSVCAVDWRTFLGDQRLRLCAAFGLAGFFGSFPRPDILHIAYIVPLVLPLFAYCAVRLTQSWRPAFRYAVVAAAIALCLPSAHGFQWRAREALRAEIVPTPRGGVFFIGQFTSGRGLPELLSSIAATPPGDAYFFYPYDEMLPFLTGREHVSKYDIFAPWYTSAAQYRDACHSVMRHASWVVVDRTWRDRESWTEIFRSMPEGKPQATLQFEQALDSAFDLVATDGTFELRRRREGVTDSLCDAIAEK